jgi:putative membrane protein
MTSREPAVLFLLSVAALVASGIAPHDRLTWWLEVTPILIAWPLLLWTRRSFPLTPLLYRLVFLHMLVLIAGAHWTYARVPLGLWVQETLSLARNHYDRLGHFVQGFVPAILAREILLRKTPLQRGGWLFYLVAAACLSFSAFFEMLEWWAAVGCGSDAAAYLATQGDVWDTQWDMFLCLSGALLAQCLLARTHDRQLAALPGRGSAPGLG